MKTQKIYTITVTSYEEGKLTSVPLCYRDEKRAKRTTLVLKEKYRQKHPDFVVVYEDENTFVLADNKEHGTTHCCYVFNYEETELY